MGQMRWMGEIGQMRWIGQMGWMGQMGWISQIGQTVWMRQMGYVKKMVLMSEMGREERMGGFDSVDQWNVSGQTNLTMRNRRRSRTILNFEVFQSVIDHMSG